MRLFVVLLSSLISFALCLYFYCFIGSYNRASINKDIAVKELSVSDLIEKYQQDKSSLKKTIGGYSYKISGIIGGFDESDDIAIVKMDTLGNDDLDINFYIKDNSYVDLVDSAKEIGQNAVFECNRLIINSNSIVGKECVLLP